MLIQELVNYNYVAFEKNTLFYGDNIDILRHSIPNELVDLVYLDPPFNSKADYNVLFRELTGEQSTAQIQAFSDFWHWDVQANHTYKALTEDAPNESTANLLEAFLGFLGKSNMLAYLVMLAIRLLELHRVLKPTGSIFLHCDTTASHYIKMLMDSVFGVENFRNEIIWQRQTAHSDARKKFGRVSDRILFYSKTSNYKFNRVAIEHKKSHIESKYNFTDEKGRRFSLGDLNPPHGRGPVYEYCGMVRPWRFTEEKMLQLEKDGKIYKGWKIPRLKRYLDESVIKGAAVQEIWDDIYLNSQARERLGFETQKPVALLERIIKSCTNDSDLILDPFCGCGTAIVASEKLRRRWIGIDITWLAINLVKGRLNDMFPDAIFRVEGEPRDMGGASELATKDRYQFQWWALSLIKARPVGATPNKPREGKKGADKGIDGWLRFHSGQEDHPGKIIVQVKSGHVGAEDIRGFRDAVRDNANMGIFITLEDPTIEMIKLAKQTEPCQRLKMNIQRFRFLPLSSCYLG